MIKSQLVHFQMIFRVNFWKNFKESIAKKICLFLSILY